MQPNFCISCLKVLKFAPPVYGNSMKRSDIKISVTIQQLMTASSLPFCERAGSRAQWLQKQVWSLFIKGGVSTSTVISLSEEISFAEVTTANLSGISWNCQSLWGAADCGV